MLILIVILKKLKSEDDDEDEDDQLLEIKIANRFRPGAEMIRVDFVFIFSFATSPGGVKGTKFSGSIRGCGLAVLAPGGAVFDDPVGQSPFKADIVASLFGLDPLML